MKINTINNKHKIMSSNSNVDTNKTKNKVTSSDWNNVKEVLYKHRQIFIKIEPLNRQLSIVENDAVKAITSVIEKVIKTPNNTLISAFNALDSLSFGLNHGSGWGIRGVNCFYYPKIHYQASVHLRIVKLNSERKKPLHPNKYVSILTNILDDMNNKRLIRYPDVRSYVFYGKTEIYMAYDIV